MKKCIHCGKENIDEAIYCADCGAKLDSSYINSIAAKEGCLNSTSSTNPYINKSNANGKADEGPSIWKICCCYVPVILFIVALILSLFMNAYPESFSTTYEDDFNYLDLNGDGKLSFEEARQYDPYMKDKEIRPYFTEADKNGNGYLIGYEFDGFRSDVRHSDSYSYSSSSSGSESEKNKYSSSSSSSNGRDYSSGNSKASNSLNNQEFDRAGGYVLTCPYCGSEAVYETGGHYRCAECGSNIYNPDDLELGYWEGYMELLAPLSLTIN